MPVEFQELRFDATTEDGTEAYLLVHKYKDWTEQQLQFIAQHLKNHFLKEESLRRATKLSCGPILVTRIFDRSFYIKRTEVLVANNTGCLDIDGQLAQEAASIGICAKYMAYLAGPVAIPIIMGRKLKRRRLPKN
jgi:hypothetical protein